MSGEHDRQLVDTNVPVDALDIMAGEKGRAARALMGKLWQPTHSGCSDVQVLQAPSCEILSPLPLRLIAMHHD